MKLADDLLFRSAAGMLFGEQEPFVNGTDSDVESFYHRLLADLAHVPNVTVTREMDHHGSGYASYISAFLSRRDDNCITKVYPNYAETVGLLLYVSRLAPIAVFAASSVTRAKDGKSGSSGFIDTTNLNQLPDPTWVPFLRSIEIVLNDYGVELLSSEPLLEPAPQGIEIPTVFDGPYYVFDTLFYWCD
jgi:hypothetical protein